MEGGSLERVEEEIVPVLHVEDASRAVARYERLGFQKEWEHQFEPGFPWFVSVARGSVRLYLSEHKGDARPDTLIHLYVNNIDAVATEFGVPVDEDGLAGRECEKCREAVDYLCEQGVGHRRPNVEGGQEDQEGRDPAHPARDFPARHFATEAPPIADDCDPFPDPLLQALALRGPPGEPDHEERQ